MKGAIEVTQRALQDNSLSRVYHAAGAGKLAGASLLILRIPAQSRDLYESAKIVREHFEVLEGFYGSFIQLKSKENPAPTAEGYERYKAEGYPIPCRRGDDMPPGTCHQWDNYADSAHAQEP